MKEEIKDIWIEALRSGEYQQGKDVLRHEDEFCCLGVLCDLHTKLTKNGHWTAMGYHAGGTKVGVLPPAVMDWAEMKSNCGTFDHGMHNLISMNDMGETFHFIADIIEQNWEKL